MVRRMAEEEEEEEEADADAMLDGYGWRNEGFTADYHQLYSQIVKETSCKAMVSALWDFSKKRKPLCKKSG